MILAFERQKCPIILVVLKVINNIYPELKFILAANQALRIAKNKKSMPCSGESNTNTIGDF
jgi:hypothetical protein